MRESEERERESTRKAILTVVLPLGAGIPRPELTGKLVERSMRSSPARFV